MTAIYGATISNYSVHLDAIISLLFITQIIYSKG